MSRTINFLTLFLWLMTATIPVIAQQKADTTYTFRFVPQKDITRVRDKDCVKNRVKRAKIVRFTLC